MDESSLAQLPLFTTLPRRILRRLVDTLQILELPPDAVLFREDDRGDHFYVLLTGTVDVLKALGTSDERLLRICEPGEVMGEMGLLQRDRLRTATVRARSPARLLVVPYASFEALLRRYPGPAVELARMLGQRLRTADDATIHDLQTQNRQLQQALTALHTAQGQLIEQEALARELALARRIQQQSLPRTLPHWADFEFGARLVPAQAVGGDFFDFIPLGPGRLGLVVGDAAGKGIPAAIFMALTRSLLRAEVPRAATPAAALQAVNHELLELNETGLFVTILYGVLDQATRGFTYVRAGHELPLVVDAIGAATLPDLELGEPVGVYPTPILMEQYLAIPPHGSLVLYTDGVTEARDRQGSMFGMERLQAAVRGAPTVSAQMLCDHVYETVSAYSSTVLQHDDVTVVAVHAC